MFSKCLESLQPQVVENTLSLNAQDVDGCSCGVFTGKRSNDSYFSGQFLEHPWSLTLDGLKATFDIQKVDGSGCNATDLAETAQEFLNQFILSPVYLCL